MFFNKKFKEIEARVDALGARVNELARKAHEQEQEIDKLYALFVSKFMDTKPTEQKTEPKSEQKPKNYRPRRRAKKMMDGKENTEATEK